MSRSDSTESLTLLRYMYILSRLCCPQCNIYLKLDSVPGATPRESDDKLLTVTSADFYKCNDWYLSTSTMGAHIYKCILVLCTMVHNGVDIEDNMLVPRCLASSFPSQGVKGWEQGHINVPLHALLNPKSNDYSHVNACQ